MRHISPEQGKSCDGAVTNNKGARRAMTQSETTLTRRGVCKQLKYSPYTFTYFHKGKFVHLAFSSKLHLEKFVELREKNHAMIYNNINKRFKFKVDCTFLSDFNLYQKVENRGCYINFGGTIYKSIDDITID